MLKDESRTNLGAFNIKTAASYIDSFCNITGVGCSLTLVDGTVVYSSGLSCENCKLCNILESNSEMNFSCASSHFYGLMQAERFGGKYIYFCPTGLTCFVSPIMSDGETIALLTGGPLLMVETEDFVQHDLVDRLSLPASEIPLLLKILREIPNSEPEKVNAMSNILFVLAAFFGSISETGRMVEEQHINEMQGEIGEFLQSFKLIEEQAPGYPFNKERLMLAAIEDGDEYTAAELLNEILGYIFFSTGGNFQSIKARVTELIVLLSRAAVSGGADSEYIFGLNFKYFNEINNFKNVDELVYWLSNIMKKFTDNVFRFTDVKHIDVIHKSIEYIRRNYARKITLDEVAKYVYLSPSYFSRVFKEEMDCNFNTYLNKIRIEKSKELLLSDNIKLVDISGMVGFDDQSYFSKVFKKLTGVTPGKFREAKGNLRAVKRMTG